MIFPIPFIFVLFAGLPPRGPLWVEARFRGSESQHRKEELGMPAQQGSPLPVLPPLQLQLFHQHLISWFYERCGIVADLIETR